MSVEIARVVVIGIVIALATAYYRRLAGDSSSGSSSRTSEKLGFLPQGRQNTGRASSDPELERAEAAAARGRWEPAAHLLAASRQRADWARRSYYAGAFGTHQAARPGSWLHAWEEAVGPDDPDLALVRSKATVSLAWHLRGGGWAKDTSREQFEGFHATLVRVPRENARAAELNPDDPTPYINEIWAGLGLGYSHEDMHGIWKEVTARDPYHYGAHYAALQYWCAKWRGSEERAMSFAREAAAAAPLGSLLTALPLIAWYEHHDSDAKAADFRAPHLIAAVDAALADVAAAPSEHPATADVRHLLAYFLTRQNRHAAALAQFRLVDGYVDALPWRYWSDPAAAYCRWRERAARGARRR
ncbi:hypothetical protein DEJ50_00840 [Streptomyces venezuelae]|uniref:DUF4034 domain-containing protein n=1 Tax=Streptomyces venezuelae TaxID=54571 RepID=A0A5P2D0H2_STRVZ|nr:hypothetical protein [Streptomyces venezuelae]QES46609.1 hypothetical protein DEJ50_00840 [Streptomyces venezuelae]